MLPLGGDTASHHWSNLHYLLHFIALIFLMASFLAAVTSTFFNQHNHCHILWMCPNHLSLLPCIYPPNIWHEPVLWSFHSWSYLSLLHQIEPQHLQLCSLSLTKSSFCSWFYVKCPCLTLPFQLIRAWDWLQNHVDCAILWLHY